MKVLLFAAAVLAGATPAMAAVVFEDNILNAGDYRITVYASPDVTTHIGDTVGYGPIGPGLYTSYSGTYGQFTNVNAPRFQFLNDNFVYDPSTQGAIDTIQTSMYQQLSMTIAGGTVNLGGTQRHLRLLAEQDGVLYEAFEVTGGSYAEPGWLNAAVNGLVASDFKVFDPANPWAARSLTGLDFSGSAITFGFELTHYSLTSGAFEANRAAASSFSMDNFNITLRTLDPVDPGVPAGVPEPSTWAMMILGFGLAGAAMRHRRPAAA